MLKRIPKAFWIFVIAILMASMAFAITVSERPGGIAFPYWYGFSAGAKSSYYLAHPTLTANDTAAGIAATQTLTNKTLTSPTITGPTMSGTATLNGLLDINAGAVFPVAAQTTGATLTIAQAESIVTNEGAGGAIILNLPEASTWIGRRFKFVVIDTNTMNINPDDADQIVGLTNAAGDSIQNTGTTGNSMVLIAINSTQIAAEGAVYGTWSDAN